MKPYPERTPEKIAQRRQQIIALSIAGHPVAVICNVVGVGRSTVTAVRRQAGLLQPRPPKLTDDELHRAEELLADGCSISEVARTLGRSHQCIGRRFPGRGWSMDQRDEHMRTVRLVEGNWQRKAIENAFALNHADRVVLHT